MLRTRAAAADWDVVSAWEHIYPCMASVSASVWVLL
jgi:hypothetical protein